MKKAETSTQILDTSRELLNEHGVESVSISQIAQELQISTGNLTYHFSKKKDIVAQHIRGLEDRMVIILENFPYGASAEEFIDAYAGVFQLTWDYRYLFNGTSYLIQNDLISKSQYQSLVDHVYRVVLEQTDNMVDSGLMKPIPAPHDSHTLVNCVWWQWLGWLEASQLLPSSSKIAWEELLENGIKHLLFLVQPYMSKKFSRQLYSELQNLQSHAVVAGVDAKIPKQGAE